MAASAFVTGATGFTGGRLCERLVARGDRVKALARNPGKAAGLRALGVEIVPGDLREPSSFEGALGGIDVVYHIAAAFREARLSDSDYWDINVGGTVNIVRAASRAGVGRFVHCSTVGVHGDTGRTPVTEEAPYKLPDFYCKSKLEGELKARELFQQLGLAGTVFRPAGIYGPGDLRFLKLFRSIRKGRFFMLGSGETLYHFTYIDDLCDGILLCGERPEALGDVFILGGEAPVTLNELVRHIAAAVDGRLHRFHIPLGPVYAAAVVCEQLCRPLGIEPPIYPRRVEFFSKDRAVDITKARRVLGFAPKVSVQEGVVRTAAWYRAQGLL
jgi:nucleoside-diphosphate-sugar epimerase